MTDAPRNPRPVAHGVDRTSLRLAVYALLALAAVWPFLEGAGGLNDFRDAHILSSYERDAATTVLEHGQAPLWDPYYCGGMYALGSPQTRFASPTFALTLALGVERAEPVIAWLLLLAGMEGMFRLLRRRARSAWAPFVVAPAFALNGWFGVAFYNGWTHFFGFEFVPWTVLGVRLALEGRVRGLVLAAAGFAFMTGFGGTYAVPMTALVAGLECLRALAESAPGPGRWARMGRVTLAFVAVGLFAVALSAFRLWPVAETLGAAPRVMAGEPTAGLATLAGRLFRFVRPGASSVGSDGSFFLGPWLLPLALIGVAQRRAWWAAGFGLLALWTATGYASSLGPFPGLRLLPVFETFRYPERFLLFFGFYAVEVATHGLEALAAWGGRRGWALRLAGLGVAVVVVSLGTQVWNLRAAAAGMKRVAPPEPQARASDDFHQARGNRWLLSYYLPMDRGSLSCMEAWPVPQSPALRGDLEHEEVLVDLPPATTAPADGSDPPDPFRHPFTAGTLRRVHWSPERLELRAVLARPARLVVNQNHHPGWQSSVGRVVSHGGLLGADLPAGTHDVTLTFRPRSALGGALVSLAALLALLALLARARRRQHLAWLRLDLVTVAAVAFPAVVFGAVLTFVAEPPASPQPLQNPNGAAALLDVLPNEATPLDVAFDEPVHLVGARVPATSPPDGIVPVELYWRVSGPVEHAVGVFVHVDGPGGKRVQADHQVLAGSLFLDDAPPSRVIRDAFTVDLSGKKPGTWNVYVGLWYASGGDERVTITAAPGVRVENNRALVGIIERPGASSACSPQASGSNDAQF